MAYIFSSRARQYWLILFFCILTFCSIFLPKDTFLYLVKEDGPYETMGALLFLAAAIMYFLLYFSEKRFALAEDRSYFSTKFKRIWFFLLGLLFIFLMGEEISWGQRIFGFEGIQGNIQGETNLHNLFIFNVRTSEPGAEVKTQKEGLAALFTAKKIFVYIFVSFLLLLPLATRYLSFVRQWVRKLYIPIPAVELGVLFVINILLFKAFKVKRYIYDGAGRGLEEIEEFNFALILFMVPFVWLLNKKGFLKFDWSNKH